MHGIHPILATACVLMLAACAPSEPAARPTVVPTPRLAGTPSPPSATSPSTTTAPEPGGIGLADLPSGPGPKLGFTQGYVYVAPDGTRTTLPRGRGVGSVTPTNDGLLMTDGIGFEGSTGLRLVTASGEVADLGCSSGRPLASPDGRGVWMTISCPESGDGVTPSVHFGSATQSLTGNLLSVVGVSGEQVVFDGSFVGPVSTTNLVDPPLRLAGLTSSVAVAPHRGVAVGRVDSGDERVGAVDLKSGQVLWSVAGWELIAISPDERSVVAFQLDWSGFSQRWAVFNLADGRERRAFTVPTGLKFDSAEWESNRALLMVAREGRRTAIIRADPAGNLSRATPILQVHALRPGYTVVRPASRRSVS